MLDVGGGDSRLVDYLVDRGVTCVTVLDISRAALDRARLRLGAASERVQWIESDVTADWPVPSVDIWHDRAVFHFLTRAADRDLYRTRLRQGLKPHGSLIIATFGPEGPERCSGLPVARYSPEELQAELEAPFRLQETVREIHTTPFGSMQEFWYSRLTME